MLSKQGLSSARSLYLQKRVSDITAHLEGEATSINPSDTTGGFGARERMRLQGIQLEVRAERRGSPSTRLK